MEIIDYLLARKKAGGGSDVTIEQLTATENGTYSEQGKAYSPVVVNVPAPENSYQLKDVPSGTVSTIDDGTALPMPSLKVGIEPVQDLHGYDHPWAGGAGKNLCNAQNPIVLDQAGNIGDQPCAISAGTYTFSWTSSASTAISLTLWNDSTQIGTFASLTAIQGRGNLTFTITENATYLRCYFNAATTVSDIQVESGSTATSYEPYSNICPISGWIAANVTRTGKNLFDADVLLQATGWIKKNNVYTGLNNYLYLKFKNGFPGLTFKENTQYTFSFAYSSNDETKDSYIIFEYTDSTNKRIKITTNGNYSITSDRGKTVDKLIPSYGVAAQISLDNLQLEEGTTATTYEPYNGQTYTIEFRDGDNPLTVYGGTLDVTSGELVVDRKSVDMGDLNYAYDTSYNRFASNDIPNTKAPSGARITSFISSMYEVVDDSRPISQVTSGQMYSSFNSAQTNAIVMVHDNRFTDAALFRNAVSGQTFTYELAEPITYQLTPTQVRTLVGNNNIWSDTGNIIEGKYFKSLT